MSACTKYIPYTLTEIEANIKRVYDSIIENSGMSQYERIKNGTDEYESGDVISTLKDELEMWQNLRKEKLLQDGQCVGKKFYISGQYGC